MAKRNTTQKGNRYDIQYQVVRGRKQPFVYFGNATFGYNLLHMSVEQAERIFETVTKIY